MSLSLIWYLTSREKHRAGHQNALRRHNDGKPEQKRIKDIFCVQYKISNNPGRAKKSHITPRAVLARLKTLSYIYSKCPNTSHFDKTCSGFTHVLLICSGCRRVYINYPARRTALQRRAGRSGTSGNNDARPGQTEQPAQQQQICLLREENKTNNDEKIVRPKLILYTFHSFILFFLEILDTRGRAI